MGKKRIELEKGFNQSGFGGVTSYWRVEMCRKLVMVHGDAAAVEVLAQDLSREEVQEFARLAWEKQELWPFSQYRASGFSFAEMGGRFEVTITGRVPAPSF